MRNPVQRHSVVYAAGRYIAGKTVYVRQADHESSAVAAERRRGRQAGREVPDLASMAGKLVGQEEIQETAD